ncbi:hypothetical protein F9279_12840 [Bacillus sp. B1-b2]|nr:hypothetical protein F9279_12840 [Bacillus sp. B1-b2]
MYFTHSNMEIVGIWKSYEIMYDASYHKEFGKNHFKKNSRRNPLIFITSMKNKGNRRRITPISLEHMKSEAFFLLNRKNPLISKEINIIFAISRNSPLNFIQMIYVSVVGLLWNLRKLYTLQAKGRLRLKLRAPWKANRTPVTKSKTLFSELITYTSS